MDSTSRRLYAVDGNLVPAGFEQITSLAGATALTVPTSKPDARIAVIQAIGQNVRWRDDGTAPSATVGMQLAAGNDILYTGDLSAIQFIEEAASAELNITYYG